MIGGSTSHGDGKPTDVNIEGYVWEDGVEEIKEGKMSDGLYESGSSDKRLAGVTVELINSSGEVIKSTDTSSDGSYLMEDIEVDEEYSQLKGCYIRFSGYDSSYFPVETNVDAANGSKARKEDDGVATTKGVINLIDYLNEETETVENINLGLRGKYEPKAGIMDEQIEYVKIVRNGYTFTYKYGADAMTDDGVRQDSVSFQTSSRTFTQKMYPSDISYSETTTDPNEKLAVYVVYKMTITNPETTDTPEYREKFLCVTELNNYYPSNKYILDTNTSVAESYVSSDISSWSGGGGQATCTNLSKFSQILGGETSEPTYIQFKLTEEALRKIVEKKLTKQDLETYSSEAEAFGYHVYEYQDFEWVDTTPEGATESTGYKKEIIPWPQAQTDPPDEMYSGALYIKFDLVDNRKISGNVFKDGNVRGSSYEVVGNGEREDEEKNLTGVRVSLIDADTGRITNVHIWEQQGSTWKAKEVPAVVDVNDDGTYSFEGVVPNKYYLLFTYGDGKAKLTDLNGNEINPEDLGLHNIIDTSIVDEEMEFDINNYKSTIVTGVNKSAFTSEGQEKSWFINVMGKKYSIAIDNTSNNEDGVISGEGAIDKRTKHKYEINNEVEENTDIRTINARSPKMDIQFEWLVENTLDHGNAERLPTECSGMNFGIIERPYTDLQLTRQITNLKITLNNGTTIINWTPNSTPENEPYIAALGNVNNKKNSVLKTENEYLNNYLKAELDEINIYGSTLEIRYEIVVTNLSEVDYATYDYYGFGERSANSVTTRASRVIDYLPEGFNITVEGDSGDTQKSHEISAEEYKNLKEYPDIYITNGTYEEWKDDKYKKWELRSTKELTTQIGNKDHIDKTKSLVYEFLLTKQLTPQEKDMDYNSATEIVGVTNSSLTKRTVHMYKFDPGTYDGTPDSNQPDNDYSRITIIPSTGDNQSAIIYITIGLSMIVLATGIILIKKFVLDE